MTVENPIPGQIYRNSKHQIYQIITVAQHTQTGEKLVVYQAMYPDFQIYARPLALFDSEFEKTSDFVECPKKQKENTVQEHSKLSQNAQLCLEEPTSGTVNPVLLEFLEASTIHEKLNVICDNKKIIDKKCISDLAVALDITIEDNDLDTQYEELVSCLNTMKRFEVGRLR